MGSTVVDNFDLNTFRRNWALYAIALAQGVALLVVYKALELLNWPYGSPVATYSLLSVLIPIPILVLLTFNEGNWRRGAPMVAGAAVISAFLGAYVGSQAEPFQRIDSGTIRFIFVITIFIALFKAAMYIQQHSASEDISYAALFKYSWRNLSSISLATCFVGLFWSLLMLWAALFQVLNIDFFHDLFTNEYFVIPVLVLAFGIATTIVRDMESLLDSSSRIPQGLIKFLLPMVVVISLTFLVTLPVKGLSLLWDTGMGTALVLWLTAITLFFVNTVYRDEPHIRPYPLFLHRFIYLGVVLLPIYTAIAFHGLDLRVAQYGWTVERCWAMVVWLFLCLFSVGYSIAIMWRKDYWIELLSKINVVMGILLMATMIFANTPALDFRKISLNSQLDRLNSGEVAIDEFDFRYVQRHLGKPGYQAAIQIKSDIEAEFPELAIQIESLYAPRKNSEKTINFDDFEQELLVWPEGSSPPYSLLISIYDKIEDWRWARGSQREIALILVDLNSDNEKEHIFITKTFGSTHASAWLILEDSDGSWHHQYINISMTGTSLANAINSNEIELLEPKWFDLKVGDMTIRTN